MPGAQIATGSKLPGDSAGLINEWLPAHYPAPKVDAALLLTESGRMMLAMQSAKAEMIETLRRKWLQQMKEG